MTTSPNSQHHYDSRFVTNLCWGDGDSPNISHCHTHSLTYALTRSGNEGRQWLPRPASWSNGSQVPPCHTQHDEGEDGGHEGGGGGGEDNDEVKTLKMLMKMMVKTRKVTMKTKMVMMMMMKRMTVNWRERKEITLDPQDPVGRWRRWVRGGTEREDCNEEKRWRRASKSIKENSFLPFQGLHTDNKRISKPYVPSGNSLVHCGTRQRPSEWVIFRDRQRKFVCLPVSLSCIYIYFLVSKWPRVIATI